MRGSPTHSLGRGRAPVQGAEGPPKVLPQAAVAAPLLLGREGTGADQWARGQLFLEEFGHFYVIRELVLRRRKKTSQPLAHPSTKSRASVGHAPGGGASPPSGTHSRSRARHRPHMPRTVSGPRRGESAWEGRGGISTRGKPPPRNLSVVSLELRFRFCDGGEVTGTSGAGSGLTEQEGGCSCSTIDVGSWMIPGQVWCFNASWILLVLSPRVSSLGGPLNQRMGEQGGRRWVEKNSRNVFCEHFQSIKSFVKREHACHVD